MAAGGLTNRSTDQIGDQVEIDLTYGPRILEHTDEWTTSLAHDKLPIAILAHFDHVPLCGEHSRDLAEPVLRGSPGDPRPVVIGDPPGDAFDHIPHQWISADFDDRPPNRGNYQVLVPGEQQQKCACSAAE